MTTSDASWSPRLRLVGDLERQDHWYLGPNDQCYFFGEYTPGKGFAHSATNQLVMNLKKKPETRGTAQWNHKLAAIDRVARSIAANILPEALPGLTFVPIPPSKPSTAPGYDDRMTQVARRIVPGCDVRELIVTQAERDARHTTGEKRDPAALRATLALVPALLANPPKQIVLLDDVLTTGCSFTVCRAMLQEVLPQADIFGIFVARRVVDRTSPFEAFINLEA
jgi:hypothetical protein